MTGFRLWFVSSQQACRVEFLMLWVLRVEVWSYLASTLHKAGPFHTSGLKWNFQPVEGLSSSKLIVIVDRIVLQLSYMRLRHIIWAHLVSNWGCPSQGSLVDWSLLSWCPIPDLSWTCVRKVVALFHDDLIVFGMVFDCITGVGCYSW